MFGKFDNKDVFQMVKFLKELLVVVCVLPFFSLRAYAVDDAFTRVIEMWWKQQYEAPPELNQLLVVRDTCSKLTSLDEEKFAECFYFATKLEKNLQGLLQALAVRDESFILGGNDGYKFVQEGEKMTLEIVATHYRLLHEWRVIYLGPHILEPVLIPPLFQSEN